jgi:excisionase family DNA binding protein
MKCVYEVVFTPNNVGGFDAFIPDLGCITQGDSLDDAMDAARDLIAVQVRTYIEEGKSLPQNHFGHSVPEEGYAIAIFQDVDEHDPDMTVQEVAEVLDVAKSRVYALAREGVLESHKVGSAVMIVPSSVYAFDRSPRKAGRPRKSREG